MWTKTYIILSISSGEYITLGNRRSACSGCSVYAQTMHKPQNKSRDNLLELEWMWRHHYLQQKHLAVLLGIFHNIPAPTLAPGVSLFPDFTQVCLPRLSVFVVAESLQKASFFLFYPSIWSNFETEFFSSSSFSLFALLRRKFDEMGLKTLGWESHSGITAQKKLLTPGLQRHTFSFYQTFYARSSWYIFKATIVTQHEMFHCSSRDLGLPVIPSSQP